MVDACYDRGSSFRLFLFSAWRGSLTPNRRKNRNIFVYMFGQCYDSFFFFFMGLFLFSGPESHARVTPCSFAFVSLLFFFFFFLLSRRESAMP